MKNIIFSKPKSSPPVRQLKSNESEQGFTPLEIRGYQAKTEKIHKSPKGFTIIELLIATAVFSTVLLLCTTALLQIGRLYYKGLTSARTQETARLVMDELSRNIQFGDGNVTPLQTSGTNFFFCTGQKRYTFIKGRQLNDTPTANQRRNVLVVESPVAACNVAVPNLEGGATVSPPGGRELLGTNMRVVELDVAETAAGSKLYSIKLRILAGDDEVLIQPPSPEAYTACGNFREGTQFCAAANLSTVVKKRL